MPKLKPGTIWPTPEEDEAINKAIAEDPDTFEADDEMFANAKHISQVDPEFYEGWKRAQMKRKGSTRAYVLVDIDLDLAHAFQQDGDGWEKRLNDTLRKAVFGD